MRNSSCRKAVTSFSRTLLAWAVSRPAAYPIEPWLEHFEWLGPMFNEQMQLKDGRMYVSDRPGLGFTLSEQAIAWRAGFEEFGKRP